MKPGKRQTSGPLSNTNEVSVRNYRLVGLMPVSEKIMKQLLMETMSMYVKENVWKPEVRV